VSGYDSSESACCLRRDIRRRLPPTCTGLQGIGERDCRIEVRARDRTEGENERHSSRAGGNCVCQQGDGNIASSQMLSHDSRPDHRRQQKQASGELRNDAPFERDFHCRPIFSISLRIANCSNVEKGSARNNPVRLSKMVNASRKARSISSGVPSTAAGSGIPQ